MITIGQHKTTDKSAAEKGGKKTELRVKGREIIKEMDSLHRKNTNILLGTAAANNSLGLNKKWLSNPLPAHKVAIIVFILDRERPKIWNLDKHARVKTRFPLGIKAS